MATVTKLPSGRWRAQVRRNGHKASCTFERKGDADIWAREQEGRLDRGESPIARAHEQRESLADLIDLHFADLHELGRAIGRSKEATLLRLRDTIGKQKLSTLARDSFVQFAKTRAKEGAGPVTIGIDVSFIGTVMDHAAAVHGIAVPIDPLRLARIALNTLGLIDKSAERDRRPTQGELDRIIATADANPRQIIPLGMLVNFAVARAPLEFPRDSSNHKTVRHQPGVRCQQSTRFAPFEAGLDEPRLF